MKKIALILCGLCLLSGCGGGAPGMPSVAVFAPVATLSTTTLTFGTEAVDTTSQSLPVMLTNSGTATLDIAGIAASASFGETNTCGLTLAPGARCSISVTFTPTASGTLGGTLSVTDNAPGSPQMVSLSGTGNPNGPNASLSTTSLTFGTEILNMTSEPLSVMLTNFGTAALDIADIAASENFGETNTCTPTLAPGANCDIAVSFTPTASGTLHGTLSVTDNAPGSPQMVSLSGTGSSTGPSCSVKGQQCAPQLPPCCPGLMCSPASTRAFCEP